MFLTAQYLAIAMEYAAGGDMFEHVVKKGGLKESEARWFFQQLIVGVDYIHRMVRSSMCPSLLACLAAACRWFVRGMPAIARVCVCVCVWCVGEGRGRWLA